MHVDLFLTSGGAWGSEKDLILDVVESLNWQGLYHRVRMGPGKPVGFGLLQNKPFFFLPGGPPSNEMAFLQLAIPAILKMTGGNPAFFPFASARLAQTVKGKKTWTDFVHARLENRENQLWVHPARLKSGLQSMAGKEALIIMTLYSPFMCAGHTSDLQIIEHIKDNPAKAKKGLEIITESLMIFVKECIKLGVDGFYHSTQGGESQTLNNNALFRECIKPYDLILMEEINRSCDFNILHVCDYHGGYDDLTPFLDYPGHIVNCSLELGPGNLTAREVSQMFGRPFMGGLDRLGTIFSGSRDEIKSAVEAQCSQKSAKFLLGADCTVPSDIDWDNLKTAIAAAHEFEL